MREIERFVILLVVKKVNWTGSDFNGFFCQKINNNFSPRKMTQNDTALEAKKEMVCGQREREEGMEIEEPQGPPRWKREINCPLSVVTRLGNNME